jgi:hypothetical protein
VDQKADVASAVNRGIAFLLKDQNPDGSWGSVRAATVGPEDDFWWANPETLRSWRVATTGLCCMAFMRHTVHDSRTAAALDRGIDCLLRNAELKRPSNWDTDHVWGLVYGLEALAMAERRPGLSDRRRAISDAMDALIRLLARAQTPSGGWGYYDDPPGTGWATSFITANAVLALRAAGDAGHALPPGTLPAAVRALQRARLPDGAYAYRASDAIPMPRPGGESLRNIKGSLSRIQIGNLALFKEDGGVNEEDLALGLERFFAHHRFLDVSCHRPVPHESYYGNSGYFYLYGHAYAAQVLDLLPPDLQKRHRPVLEDAVLKLQGSDGAWWDYPMMGFSKPYGTAFALMALAPGTSSPVESPPLSR